MIKAAGGLVVAAVKATGHLAVVKAGGHGCSRNCRQLGCGCG